MPTLPFKLNQDRRHHIPKQKHKVTNWREYAASLRQRGSLTVWFSTEAIEGWRAAPRTTRGGQPWYSPLAILTALTLRTVFRLALRQTEGLIGSILHLLGLDLAVPDHSTLSRRAETLEVPRPLLVVVLRHFEVFFPSRLIAGLPAPIIVEDRRGGDKAEPPFSLFEIQMT